MVIVLAGAIFGPPSQQQEARNPSTFSRGPFGAGGFYALSDYYGLAAGRWMEDFTKLPGSGVGAMVVANPVTVSYTPTELNSLAEWVQDGGTLILFFSGMQIRGVESYWENQIADMFDMTRPFTFEEPALPGVQPPVWSKCVRAFLPLKASAGAPGLVVEEIARPLLFGESAAWLPLYMDGPRVYGAESRFGRGTVIAVASAAPILNASILKGDNLAFALNIARIGADAGGLFFDEYHHGHMKVFSFADLFNTMSFIGLAAICGTAAVLFVASKGRRFGTARPTPKIRRRSALEYVRSVAGLYMRGQFRRHALEVIMRSWTGGLSRAGLAVRVEQDGAHAWRGSLAREVAQVEERISRGIKSDSEMLQVASLISDAQERVRGGEPL